MNGRQVLRWQIPVDDADHELACDGPVLAAETAQSLWRNGPKYWVSFWTCDAPGPGRPRTFRAFGTGQPVPDGYAWRATTDRVDGLVWHLFERES